MPLVAAFRVDVVVFRGGRLLAFDGLTFAVRGVVFRRAGGGLAARVGTGYGGENAATAAQDESPGETNMYELTRHGFYLIRLINTPKASCLYARAQV